MILVDTTVWVDFLNNKKNEKVKKLADLLKNKSDVYITDIILTEILQGIKNDKEYEDIKDVILSLKFVHAEEYRTYVHAADIFRLCRKKGITIRKTIDCLIAAIVIENNLTLLHNDNDFDNIARCIDINFL